MAMQTTDDSATVAEISSFQLETVTTFHPAVSAILNVTPDHLNRHHTMENYMEAKGKIALHQTKDEVCVLNYDNSYTRAFGAKCRAKVVWFSSKEILDDGYYLKDGFIYQANGGESSRLLAVSEMHLVGTCNYENVMAAIAIGTAMGVSMESILDTVRNFHAVEHRIEYVTTKRGVRFYNDSKGTNPDAAIQGIRAMDAPTCLIGGGYDKESEYDEWIKAFDGKVKKLVLIGQTAQKIAQTAKRLGFTDYIFADSLNEAIDLCYENAKEGECVLLSPACASWGMFTNYEERGNQFKEYVRALKE
jgi:UDP-N-acetylmuramoylalanine--D-glutamate ligase